MLFQNVALVPNYDCSRAEGLGFQRVSEERHKILEAEG